MLLALTLGVVSFVFSFVHGFDLFLLPAKFLLPVLDRGIPDSFAYWLAPDGGPSAGVALICLSSLWSWGMIFGACHFFWNRTKRKQSTQT
jgi:hypothetical protein